MKNDLQKEILGTSRERVVLAKWQVGLAIVQIMLTVTTLILLGVHL